MVRVKVCGITSLVDAEKALEFGADLLGFNFYPPSPRCVTPGAAARILAALPVTACNVALFVNETPAKVREVIAAGTLTGGRQAYSYVQFHGDESSDYCRAANLKVIKAFRLRAKDSLAALEGFPAEFYLLDSWTAGYGGSGATFPWEWLAGLNTGKLILSGGLTAANVASAVRRVRPYGIDVCSGVEARPGIKDHAKLKEFIVAAKST
jgi:phosphoribosylanthranilate isomerase